MRLLHAGHPDDADGLPARQPRARPKPRFARRSPANLCRCTGYQHIVEAVTRASRNAATLTRASAATRTRACSPAARCSSTTCSCRACCTWRSCAATTRTRASDGVDVSAARAAAGRGRRLHGRGPRRLLAARAAAGAAAADPRPRLPRAARRCRWPRTRCATSASRSRWSWPRAATSPRTRSRDVVVDVEPLRAVVDLEAALAPARRWCTSISTSNLAAHVRAAQGRLRGGARRSADVVIAPPLPLRPRRRGRDREPRAWSAQWDAQRRRADDLGHHAGADPDPQRPRRACSACSSRRCA